jgi:hypothetical protein
MPELTRVDQRVWQSQQSSALGVTPCNEPSCLEDESSSIFSDFVVAVHVYELAK